MRFTDGTSTSKVATGGDTGEHWRKMQQTGPILSEFELQLYIGEYLSYLTDGVVATSLDGSTVTVTVVDECAVLQPALFEIIASLLDGMSVYFGISFHLISISCAASVAPAPSPLSPLSPMPLPSSPTACHMSLPPGCQLTAAEADAGLLCTCRYGWRARGECPTRIFKKCVRLP